MTEIVATDTSGEDMYVPRGILMLQLMVLFALSQTVYQHRVQPMAETHVQVSAVDYSNCDDQRDFN